MISKFMAKENVIGKIVTMIINFHNDHKIMSKINKDKINDIYRKKNDDYF